jgi:hypothetical protein
MRSSVLLPLAALMVAGLLVGYSALQDDGPGTASAEAIGAPVEPPVVMVRSGDRVPAAWASRAAAVPGVAETIYVRRGQTLLQRVTRT